MIRIRNFFTYVSVSMFERDDLSVVTRRIIDSKQKEVDFEELYDEFIDLDGRLTECLERKFREKGGGFLQRDGQNVIDLTDGLTPVEDGHVLLPIPMTQG